MPDICVRPFAGDDLDPVFKMVQELAAHHGDVARLTLDNLRHDALGVTPWLRILVAEADGEVCAYAALCPLAQLQFGVRGLDIHHLFVELEMRGQGVGRALIAGVMQEARELGCRYITVGTHPDNTAAGAMYLAAGFTSLSPPGPRFVHRFEL